MNERLIALLVRIRDTFHECFVVGGVIRDIVNGTTPDGVADVDVMVQNLPISKLREIAEQFKVPFVVLDEENKVYRLVLIRDHSGKASSQGQVTVDVSYYNDLQADILRRDFTVNTLRSTIDDFVVYLRDGDRKKFSKNVIDDVCGLKDLRNKYLRMTSLTVFKDDPLRLLRAARFKAFGYAIDPNTDKAIKKHAKLIKRSASERVNEELKKILSVPNAYPVLEWMDKNGLLEIVFPEVRVMKTRGRNTNFRRFYFHPEGLWQHVKLTVKKTEVVLNTLKKHFPKTNTFLDSMITPQVYLLKLAALLHDSAKPVTATREKDGRVRFFYHEVKSAEMAEKAMKRLKFSRNDTATVIALIKDHMRIGNLCHAKNVSERAYVRLFNELGDVLMPLIILSLADRYSYDSIPERAIDLKLREMPVFRKFVRKLVNKYIAFKNTQQLPRLVDGNVLVKRLGLKPGPVIGEIINAVREEQQLGSITSRESAMAFSKHYLTKTHPELHAKQ